MICAVCAVEPKCQGWKALILEMSACSARANSVIWGDVTGAVGGAEERVWSGWKKFRVNFTSNIRKSFPAHER